MTKKLLLCLLLFFNLNSFSFSQSRVKWKAEIGAPIISSAVVDHDLAFVGALDSTLYAINISDGKISWKLKTNGEIRSNVVVDSTNVYLLGGNGVLTCADKLKGIVRWRLVFDQTAVFMSERRYDFADYYDSSPLIENNRLYFGSGSGNFFCS